MKMERKLTGNVLDAAFANPKGESLRTGAARFIRASAEFYVV